MCSVHVFWVHSCRSWIALISTIAFPQWRQSCIPRIDHVPNVGDISVRTTAASSTPPPLLLLLMRVPESDARSVYSVLTLHHTGLLPFHTRLQTSLNWTSYHSATWTSYHSATVGEQLRPRWCIKLISNPLKSSWKAREINLKSLKSHPESPEKSSWKLGERRHPTPPIPHSYPCPQHTHTHTHGPAFSNERQHVKRVLSSIVKRNNLF